jgi:integrase
VRQGELLALRWSDVDVDTGVLQVRHSVAYVNGTGFVESEPKTRAGRRKVVLPRVVIAALRRHRERQAEECLKAGEKWHEQGLVFPTVQSNSKVPGGFLRANSVVASFKLLLKRAGFAGCTVSRFAS